MQGVPGEEEQARLLDAIDELIEQRGLAAYVAAPILLPQTRFFPDPWSPDLRGVYLLARRLLAYAGLVELQVAIEAFTEDDPPPLSGTGGTSHSHQGVAAWFAGIAEGVCLFGVRTDQLQSADKVVAAMAHEVCHAYRTHHGLCIDDSAEEERLTDLTSSYLGFGVLTLNASYLYRASGYLEAQQAVTTWSHSQLGYLSPQAMAYLLAMQLEVRQVDGAAARQLLAEVETNQASYVRESRRVLAERFRGPSLLEELGLPPRQGWPPPVPLETALAVWSSADEVGEIHEAVERTGMEPALAELAPAQEPVSGPRRALRVSQGQGWAGFFVGLSAGVLGAYAIGSLDHLTLGLILAATFVGWRVGRAIVHLRCSACSAKVASEPECPGCHCQLVATARPEEMAKTWLDVDQDEDDEELAREAEAAGQALEAQEAQEAEPEEARPSGSTS